MGPRLRGDGMVEGWRVHGRLERRVPKPGNQLLPTAVIFGLRRTSAFISIRRLSGLLEVKTDAG